MVLEQRRMLNSTVDCPTGACKANAHACVHADRLELKSSSFDGCCLRAPVQAGTFSECMRRCGCKSFMRVRTLERSPCTCKLCTLSKLMDSPGCLLSGLSCDAGFSHDASSDSFKAGRRSCGQLRPRSIPFGGRPAEFWTCTLLLRPSSVTYAFLTWARFCAGVRYTPGLETKLSAELTYPSLLAHGRAPLPRPADHTWRCMRQRCAASRCNDA